MGKVILDMAISVDGYISGPDDADVGLYDWYFSREGNNAEVVDELVADTGAIIMGRNVFGVGADAQGFEETPYHVPHFVLTHRPPDRNPAGVVDFRFVTDGIESALRQAEEVAGEKLIAVGGGADIARQYLRAGLIDELALHVVPRIVGAGKRLFEDSEAGIESWSANLEVIRVLDSPGVTHLWWRVNSARRSPQS